ncbi:MAG TPA: head-tail connector protein [Lysobacter sp.]
MPLVTLDQARAHVREGADFPEAQIEPALKGAEDAAQAYLNRRVYESQEALDAARGTYAADMGDAKADYDAAVVAAAALSDEAEQVAALELAAVQFAEAKAEAAKALHGMVANDSVVSAILLTFGHLFANREDVVVGASVAEIPLGARTLLRPYRRVMMP